MNIQDAIEQATDEATNRVISDVTQTVTDTSAYRYTIEATRVAIYQASTIAAYVRTSNTVCWITEDSLDEVLK